jgi:hypothetical protein
MNITIYKHPRRHTFVAVPVGKDLPGDYQDYRCFKTIDLQPGQDRIGLVEPASAILDRIGEVGWSVM